MLLTFLQAGLEINFTLPWWRQASLNKQFNLKGHYYRVTSSIGFTLFPYHFDG